MIELLVVMGIIALVMGLGVAVYFGTADYNRLHAAIRDVQNGLGAARSAAILERTPMRFRYSVERHCTYWVAEEEAPNLLGEYGDAGAGALTGSQMDFLKGNVVREPLVGGNATSDTTAGGDDVQVVAATSPATAGQVLVLPGPDGTLDSIPPTSDDEAAYTYVEDRFAEAPQYLSDKVLVARPNAGTGVWERLDFDVIFDRNGRASFPPGFETTMRRLRVALVSGDLPEYELVIVPTTGEVIVREQ